MSSFVPFDCDKYYKELDAFVPGDVVICTISFSLQHISSKTSFTSGVEYTVMECSGHENDISWHSISSEEGRVHCVNHPNVRPSFIKKTASLDRSEKLKILMDAFGYSEEEVLKVIA